MIQQAITVRTSEDPFDVKTINVMVPAGVKILSDDPNVEDMLALFNSYGNDDAFKINDVQGSYITKGIIYKVSNSIALIDIDAKNTASCKLEKEPKEIVEQLVPGMQVDVKIHKGADGTLYASISDAMSEVVRQEIFNSIGNSMTAYRGVVKELIHGGYWVDVAGIRCFMPGSLGGLNKLHDFEMILGKEMIVMPITYSNEKNTIVVSHREYLTTLIPNAIDDLRDNLKTRITGMVTGTTEFGVFAEFNDCLTGLIPKDELTDSLNTYNSRGISAGDSISFWIKDIISNKKIILTQKGPQEDPWEAAGKKYSPMSKVQGKVTKITVYGAFVELEKGVSGLIHKSQLENVELKKGDYIIVTIRSISPAERKITMTLN
jgi:small subunit ribosomal protein S1